MRTPAVYDLQTEKLAFPETATFTIGTDADVSTPIASPRGNRGGIDNVDRLLDDVEDRHVTVAVDGESARLTPHRSTATIYVDSSPVEGQTTIRNAETVVLGSAKSPLWEGYRLQVFF